MKSLIIYFPLNGNVSGASLTHEIHISYRGRQGSCIDFATGRKKIGDDTKRLISFQEDT